MTHSSRLDTLETRESICMLVTSDLDHDPRVQKEAELAAKAGYDVTVICRTHTKRPVGYRVIPISIGRRSTRAAKYLERFLTNLRMVQKAVSLHPAIIHANDLDTLPAGYIASRISGAKLLYDSHELWPDASDRLGSLGRELATVVQRFIGQRADSIVTVNEYIARCLAESVPGSTPVTVLNVPWYVTASEPGCTNWATQFAGKKVVLYQGIYAPQRELQEAILAVRQFPIDTMLVFRGYGPLEQSLRNLVSDQGLSERVAFVPPVPMSDLVGAAVGSQIGLVLYTPVHQNHVYASPNKLFEYIMAGVPCVGSDLPFIRDILYRFGVGDVCKSGDPADLARVVTDILNTPGKLEGMKQRCIEAARQLSWDIEGQKLIGEYERILTTSRKRSAEVPSNQVAA